MEIDYSSKMDFIIHEEECNESKFEYYLPEELNIKSITLKSISFFNSCFTGDFLPEVVKLIYYSTSNVISVKHRRSTLFFYCRELLLKKHRSRITDEELDFCERTVINNFKEEEGIEEVDNIFELLLDHNRHFSLSEFCSKWQEILIKEKIDHVQFNCDNSNYLIIELTEDREFKLRDIISETIKKNFKITYEVTGGELSGDLMRIIKTRIIKIFNEWLGFKQETFNKKGKYYSRRPLPFYVTKLFLRSNLTKSSFNNKESNIFSIIPVDDSDQVKLQRYDLLLSKFKCIKEVNKCTNHIKFELTDDKGKIVNLRGTPITLELELELNPCINLIDNC